MRKKIFFIIPFLIFALLFNSIYCYAEGSIPITTGNLSEFVSEAVDLDLVPPSLLEKQPSEPITRSEFCDLICWAGTRWGDVYKENTSSLFTDTTDPNILACSALGIVSGYPDGTFRPNNPISRNESSVMLYRTAQCYNMCEDAALYPHVWNDEIPKWCYEFVTWCYFNGIMVGTGDNCFGGDGSYTREQAIITVLHLDKLNNGEAQKREEYYPIYSSWNIDGNYAEDGSNILTDPIGVVDSSGSFTSQATVDPDVYHMHSVGRSTRVENTILGKEVYLQSLTKFFDGIMWFEDLNGNCVEVPGVGKRFRSVEIYHTTGGDVFASFVLLENESEPWSQPSSDNMVHMNLTTGKRLSAQMPYLSQLEDNNLVFCAGGNGIYAIQNGGSVFVYNVRPEPVEIKLTEEACELMGFCNGLLVVKNRYTVPLNLYYYTPFGDLVYTAVEQL